MNNFTEQEFETTNENKDSGQIKSQMLDLQAKINQFHSGKINKDKFEVNSIESNNFKPVENENTEHKHCSLHCNLGENNKQANVKDTNTSILNNKVTNLNDIYAISEEKPVPTFVKTTAENKTETIEKDSNLYVVKNQYINQGQQDRLEISNQDKKLYQAQNNTVLQDKKVENINLELQQKPTNQNVDKSQIQDSKVQEIKENKQDEKHISTQNKIVNNVQPKQVKQTIENTKLQIKNKDKQENNIKTNNAQHNFKQKETSSEKMEEINEIKKNKTEQLYKTEQLFNNINNLSQSELLTQKKFQKPNKDNNNNANVNKPGHSCLDNMLRSDTYLTGEVATLYNDFLYIVKKHNLAKKSEDEIRAAFVESILKFLPKHFENRLEHRALKLFKDKYKWIIDKIYTNQIRTVEDILHFVFYEYESRGYLVDSEQEALYDFMYMPQYSKNTFFAEIVDEYVETNLRVIPEEHKFNFMKLFKNTDTVKVAKVHWNTQQVHLKAVKQELRNHLKRYLQESYDKQQIIKELARLEKTI